MISKILDPVLVILGLIHFKLMSRKYCYSKQERVKNNQFRMLKRLVCVAYDEIPFYKSKYNACNFNPHKDFKSLEDVAKIPVLCKKEAKKNQANLININRNRFSLKFKTSGSTGEPFTALVSPQHWIVEQSCIWRHWSWAGYRFRDRMAIVRSHVPSDENDLVRWDKLRNFIYFSPFHLTDEHIKYYLSKMVELKVIFLRGYPSSISVIADYVRRHPYVKLPKFKAILTASEHLGHEQQKMIEKNLHAPVFNHYGLAEQIVMFGSCAQGSRMHNYEEYGYLELLDTDKSNLKKVIGTNLHNYAMPLIRYDTGDLAEVSDAKCECNLTSVSIINVVGREDAMIVLKDDSSIPVTNFYTMFEHYGEFFSSWQIVQVSKDELKIIVDAYLDCNLDKLKSRLLADIKSRVGDRIDISFDFSGAFVKVSEGKQNPFVKILSCYD